MECSRKVAATLIRTAVLTYLFATSAVAQINQIDRTKLPQNTAVQHTYDELLPLDQYAQLSEAKWRYPVPKMQVIQSFLTALRTLQKQLELAPNNSELQIFTGLVAHLAYNLGIDEGDGLALSLLEQRANDDLRASWFFGMHQCQSNASVAGMQRLLHLEEESSDSLSGAFWQDYAICAGLTNMPVHAVRAYDIAKKDPEGPPIDQQLEQTARARIKPSSVTDSYPGRQAWYPERTNHGNRVTSTLCGESFTTSPASHLNLRDVGFGTCLVTVDTDTYPSRYGPSSASLLLGIQIAKPGESLEAFSKRTFAAFSQGILKDPGQANENPAGIHCPVATCQAFEIVTDKLYKQEGGAHLLAVFFQAEQPDYPGLRFETPEPSRVVNTTARTPTYLRPEDTLQRFNGTLYMFVTLDANLDIYPRARTDFDDLLKSLVVDSK